MKRPGFFQGVLVAAALGIAASIVAAALAPLIGLHAVVRLLIPTLGLAYVLYLFSRSAERTGRITAIGTWLTIAAMSWWLAPPLPLYLAIHAGAVWLLRSLYFYSGVMPSLLDLGLSAFAVAVTAWAATHSGSLFLATWSFFLVQALFVAIPPVIRGRRDAQRPAAVHNEKFETARRQADAALRQLFNQ